MHIGVFVQALRVLVVAGEWVEAVPLGGSWIVPAGSVVVFLNCGVEVFATVTEWVVVWPFSVTDCVISLLPMVCCVRL